MKHENCPERKLIIYDLTFDGCLNAVSAYKSFITFISWLFGNKFLAVNSSKIQLKKSEKLSIYEVYSFIRSSLGSTYSTIEYKSNKEVFKLTCCCVGGSW